MSKSLIRSWTQIIGSKDVLREQIESSWRKEPKARRKWMGLVQENIQESYLYGKIFLSNYHWNGGYDPGNLQVDKPSLRPHTHVQVVWSHTRRTEKKPALTVFMISPNDLAPLITAIEARYTENRERWCKSVICRTQWQTQPTNNGNGWH